MFCCLLFFGASGIALVVCCTFGASRVEFIAFAVVMRQESNSVFLVLLEGARASGNVYF
jgi:hypothetical protein